MKDKEKDLDAKLKVVKEKDKSMKAEQKQLELQKKQLLSDEESVQLLEDDWREAEGRDCSAGVADWGKRAELKQELEKCRRRAEFLLKEAEELEQERERSEKEREVLEEKRAQINKEQKDIVEERERLEKMKYAGGERLKKEENDMQEYAQRELEAIRLEKESFEARKSMNNWREEMEKALRGRERAFEVLKERELNTINNLKEVACREREEIESERHAMDKERQEVVKNKEKLEEQQYGIKKDIDELGMLSNKLRNKESRNNEGGADASDILNIKRPPSEDLGSNSQGRMSWLRKCTSKIFSISPTRKSQHVSAPAFEEGFPSSPVHADMEERVEGSAHPQSDGIKRDAGGGYSVSVDEPEDSELSELKNRRHKPGGDRRLDQAEQGQLRQCDESRGINVTKNQTLQESGNVYLQKESRMLVTAKDTLRVSLTGGRRKRQQIVAPEEPTPGQKRYNLRRHKIAGLTAATQASSDLMKGEKTADGAAAVEPIQNLETASGLSLGVTSENNKSTDLVQVTTVRSVELSQDKVVRVISYCSCEADVDDQAEAAKSVGITELSEEVNRYQILR
ncbi:hypothetical protein NC653_022205 [Populus alba x Populus x berolinensis]|uniref:Uncharacterized protein n=1 Tax=Populus alba x Populus x berolinensis TaxID=444605 RepID=A0AAD6VUE1_9ROSI|nr:hypothetical protein NC653_022205 [Populus alba x Populus x berolinensis]